ncbi:serine/threonine/tyrosine-protein kinase HT1 [Ricinus communis]|uniref:Protein-tyrosine kinase, putative n=1 Tax=Ricinus communis TaxID=3988 RepID=B9RBD2_RICCO|nr:serine/threonine/tyrosine-protein kinase HT1 [Ricinus communis]EEF50853.1 protein-tyrosine kinase, putative [Ricinus communis]|eukprot:XP_015571522.1 serine/threonine-protein kinase HT1 [Ricinus communis]
MEEENSSWIRRTKFSHTVCHRLDSSRLASLALAVQEERNSGLKSRPGTSSPNRKSLYFSNQRSASFPNKKSSSSVTSNSQIQRNPVTNKLRSLSPLPQTALSDTFKEARSDRKRFSTPHPRSKDQDKGFAKPSKHASNTSPLRQLASLKGHEKLKSKKDSAWTKYFDHAGGRVNAVEAADEFSVDMSKLFLGLRFAHGAHSRLYHGVYKDEPVAVKIIRAPDDDDNGTLSIRLKNQYDREVTLLSRLHHPNVIKFVAACKMPPVYCVITEYLSEGSLRAYLHKLEHKSLPLEKLIAIALDIARGMEYIHSQSIIHRDLKPENVLIDQEFRMKIADFGIACEEAYCDSLADDPGTYRWMAPEMIKKKSYGKRVDVYSFGLILWELVAGTIPYEDMNPIQAAFAVVNKNLRPVIPRDCHPAMRALIEQCWSLQPDKRPEFWQIVKVLEQFGSSLARDGTLNLVQNPTCQDHKKGLLHWIQKLGPMHPSSSPMPKPKFT